MRIGITCDLRTEYRDEGFTEEELAEFDSEETVDAIEDALSELGYAPDRIGGFKQLVGRVAQGEEWDMVFNIAEGMNGIGREAQVPALLDAYGIPYTFSDPLVLALTLHKAMTKRIIRQLGVATPDFTVVEDAKDIDRCTLPFPLFVKPLAEGTGKGISDQSRVSTKGELRDRTFSLFERFHQPVLVETFLPGREFTVGILGTGSTARVLGIMEVILTEEAEAGVYSYVNKERCEDLVRYRLIDDNGGRGIKETALAAWKGLGCRDAGRVDIRMDAMGTPHFLEVNPLAGLHPTHSDLPIIASKTGMIYRDLIGAIMVSARMRTSHSDRRSHS